MLTTTKIHSNIYFPHIFSQAKDPTEYRVGVCQDGPVHGRHHLPGARDERAARLQDGPQPGALLLRRGGQREAEEVLSEDAADQHRD